MIKVVKDLTIVPISLEDDKTLRRRNTCIKDEKYHQKNDFHQRFKQADVKEALKKIYYGKCAFCEQKISICTNNLLEDCSSTVEHYRPKSHYYWLAYSWDNLLWCCHRCNQNKANNFELLGTPVVYHKDFITAIHTSTCDYQAVEQPKMIHPELESVLDKVNFGQGVMASEDERLNYTIRKCGLARSDLNEKRKKVIDDFVKKMNDVILAKQPKETIIKQLLDEFKDHESEFRALRYWILRNVNALVS
jgi:uncharacterized protein (TIGR02646 family)